jgi:hypothetical protein
MTGLDANLTAAEQEALLIASHTVEPMQHTGRALFAAVESILRDRAEAVQTWVDTEVNALATEWERLASESRREVPSHVAPNYRAATLERCASSLRAAVTGDISTLESPALFPLFEKFPDKGRG